MKSPFLKIRTLLGMASLLVLTAGVLSCGMGGQDNGDTGFSGLGQGQVTTTSMMIQGEIQFKGFRGGEIIVEAREPFPCVYGACPVIEKPPLGYQVLSSPGPFTLALTETGKSAVIIASYLSDTGETRIAHREVSTDNGDISGLDLSLDRPYPPLR